ncbi:MAG: ATP-dependent helicase [Pirellulaceae bacterium]
MDREALLAPLNPSQREAVQHVEGPLLTLAGPGSGKTRVVTHRIAYLLQQGIPSYSILALTFTNKAAQEMRSRLDQMVGPSQLWMGTFHGYCARFLRRYGRMVGLPESYSIYDPSDAKGALEKAIRLAGVTLSHLNLDQIARAISQLKNRLVTPDQMERETGNHLQHLLKQIYPAYQSVLLQCSAVDFDDLLLHTATLLRSHPELRSDLDRQHRYILVDEYQDTNQAQYLILRALSVDFPNLNVTGDPDQSIYGWRGANIENILNFERDYPTVRVVRLENNYRSTPEILGAADQLIRHNQRRKQKSLIPMREGGARVQLRRYPSDRDEANQIAELIQQLVMAGKRTASDFAILYRTNAHSRLFEQALLARRIPYQLIGGFRFYQRQEIKDLLSYLNLIQNPTDDMAWKRIVNVPTRGLGDKAMEKVETLAQDRSIPCLAALRYAVAQRLLSPKACKGAADFLKLYDQLVELSRGAIVPMLQHLLKATDYVNYLERKKSEAPDQSIQSNINELLADAQQIDLQHPDGGGLTQFLEQVSLVSDADAFDGASQRVTLMTLHSCKGLEFPHVFVVAVEQEVLPHSRSKDNPDQYEEERRLLFVGMTRAKEMLQLSLADYRGFGRQRLSAASPFLMEIPQDQLEYVDYCERSPYGGDDFDSSLAQWRPGQDAWDQTESPVRDNASSYRSRTQQESWDDACQLPQDEIATRLSAMVEDRKKARKTIDSAANLDGSTDVRLLLQEGDRVRHPLHGIGKIVSAEGRGLKRILRIAFESTGRVHSLYATRADLTPAE